MGGLLKRAARNPRKLKTKVEMQTQMEGDTNGGKASKRGILFLCNLLFSWGNRRRWAAPSFPFYIFSLLAAADDEGPKVNNADRRQIKIPFFIGGQVGD